MEWLNFVGNIICTIIGKKYEKQKEETEKLEEKYKNKPELTVKRIKEKNIILDMNILVAMFLKDEKGNINYLKEYENRDEYIYRDYLFTNIGKTTIEYLEIVSVNRGKISIFDMKSSDISLKNNFINYFCTWDKRIFPKESIKVRIYFHKNRIINSWFSCAFILQYEDTNSFYWEQNFFESSENLEKPIRKTYKSFKDDKRIDLVGED